MMCNSLLSLIAVAAFLWPIRVCASTITYSTVTGYFLQDEASTNATIFDFVRRPFAPLLQSAKTQRNT